MKLILLAALLFAQLGPRTPLTPAETLLEPAMLKALNEEPMRTVPVFITGTDPGAGDILITCAPDQCNTATEAGQRIQSLLLAKRLPPPARSIRITSTIDPAGVARVKAAIHVAQSNDRPVQIVRGLWSTAAIGDEAAEVFSRQGGMVVEARPFERLGQLPFDSYGVPTTTIVANPTMANQHAAFIAAATAYFLATLPNAGSEALLSHLTVGAHARLAEDGRKAVAQMGSQQRASADVLIMFGQAIEREQRRMRSFERLMPSPVDPMLHSRILDMEKGITSVWTSMGITSSPFVPAAERIRGRGGEDRRRALECVRPREQMASW